MFLPSKEIFSSVKFSSAILQKRMRELAFLNKGINLTLIDQTSSKTKKYENKYEGGILEFVQFINQKKPILSNKNDKPVFKKPIYISSTKDDVSVECSLEWNSGYSEEVLAFTNNINQKPIIIKYFQRFFYHCQLYFLVFFYMRLVNFYSYIWVSSKSS